MTPAISKLSVFGLGKLGCPMTAVFAEAGFKVTGFDVVEPLVETLRAGNCPFSEPGLADLLAAQVDRIAFTSDAEEAVLRSDASFVIVPTPSRKDGAFSNEYVISAVERIGDALKRSGKGYHLVVVTSTVMPGSTMGAIREALEAASGRRVGPDLGLCYSPEFIALGSVIRDMQHPDLLLIGESDEKAGRLLEQVMLRSVKNKPSVCRMNPVNAEIAKLSVNCFVTMKISFANMLAELCESSAGGDAEQVTRALGADGRIGGKYLKPGLAFGGPCFPRDNEALMAFAKEKGVECDLPKATSATNRRQIDRTVQALTSELKNGGTVGILGLSYKPGTPVFEKSHAVLVAGELLRIGYRVVAFDPLVFENVVGLNSGIRRAETAAACVADCDGLLVADPTVADPADIAKAVSASERLACVVDSWRCLDSSKLGPRVKLLRVGRSARGDALSRLHGAA